MQMLTYHGLSDKTIIDATDHLCNN